MESQALWRAVRAPILARAGDLATAETLARTAVDIVRRMEAPNLQAETLVELADVLRIAGRHDEARTTMTEALQLYTVKGNRVGAARCAAFIEGLPGRRAAEAVKDEPRRKPGPARRRKSSGAGGSVS